MRFYTNVKMIGNRFLVRGYENGESVKFKEEYSPTLFVRSKKETEYKTLEGEYVKAVQPGSVKESREFLDEYKDVHNFPIYGQEKFIYQYISDKYPEDEIKFDISKIKVYTIDIETTTEEGFPDPKECIEEILLITIQDYNTKQITTWGVNPFDNKQDNVHYIECKSEKDLLNQFLVYWENNIPDIITGWNIEFFDVPYICGRLQRVLGEKRAKSFSPWGLVTRQEVEIFNKTQVKYDLGGLSQLDYLAMYKKFTYKAQESYRLDYIASIELGQKKLDHSEFDTFKDFYTNGWQKFVEYNIIDVELVDRLEEKMKLIELVLKMSFDAKVNFEDVFYQVRMWDAIIYNFLKKKNIVIPPNKKEEKDEKYEGAYVKEPIPGSYDWVVSFDLNSLYPHLIMQYNISPETLLDERHPTINVNKVLNKSLDLSEYSDYAVCANGAMFRKDIHGFLPELMEKIYNERKGYKKKMLQVEQEYVDTKNPELLKEIAKWNNFQMARKIQLNSAYGAVGNQYFRYYKIENAEAVTLSGKVSIQWIMNAVNGYLNQILKSGDTDYVIASDTDSLYITLGPLVDKVFKGKERNTEKVVNFIDKACKTQFEDYIEKSYTELADYVNAYDQKMVMKRECIAERGIWTAKKRYILSVWNSEGTSYLNSGYKLKVKGMESVKSSTPGVCREMLKSAYKILLEGTNDEVIQYIEECRERFKKCSVEEISFPRSVSDVVKWRSSSTIYLKGTGKGCPIHVRGALLFNHHIKEKNLTHKYSLIQNGEKVKYCYLKMPNLIHENVITFIQDFPKELGLKDYVDYDIQFTKGFLDPLKIILNAIGWESEKTASLMDFFE